MSVWKTLALAAAMSCAGAQVASAATLYRLDATLKSNGSQFWVIYDDLDGDTLFSLDELVEWSTYGGRPKLTAVPGYAANYLDGSGVYWKFKKGSSTVSHYYSHWRYARSALTTEVPAPASLPLAVIGLGGLAAVARPRRARAEG
ncbi:hypothetical protein [uncultured Albimonas sp.]|uniref:hypothetical protein n=1 Tax=uncultured Albimonas sp. TaxID=1331701 RepID=UPI0030EE1179|tara:strand:- start:1398 stop:1832 length:435 start_codon:yes stop_codon:yes gene_type:complete